MLHYNTEFKGDNEVNWWETLMRSVR